VKLVTICGLYPSRSPRIRLRDGLRMRSNGGMRRCRLAVLVGGFLLLTTTAGAVGPRARGRITADTLTAMPSANLGKPFAGGAPGDCGRNRRPPRGRSSWRRARGKPRGIARPACRAGSGARASPRRARSRRPTSPRPSRSGRSPRTSRCSRPAHRSPTSSWCRTRTTETSGRSALSRSTRVASSSVDRSAFSSSTTALFVIGSEALPNITLPPGGRVAASGRGARCARGSRDGDPAPRFSRCRTPP